MKPICFAFALFRGGRLAARAAHHGRNAYDSCAARESMRPTGNGITTRATA